jgi:hypothetical protein
MRKIAPPITTAQIRNEAATIALRGALMPKPTKISVTHETRNSDECRRCQPRVLWSVLALATQPTPWPRKIPAVRWLVV